MRKLSFLALCLVACAPGVGCAKKADVAGIWRFKEMTGAAGQASKQMANATVEFKEDKTFTMGGGPQAISGTYAFANGKAAMTVKKIGTLTVDDLLKQADKFGVGPQARKSLAAPMVGALSEDGDTMTVMAGDGKPESLVFTRA